MGLILGFVAGLSILLMASALFGVKATALVQPRRTWFTARSRIESHVWPDFVDDLASAVRAGLSFPVALESLALHGPEVIRPSVTSALQRYRVSGDLLSALEVFRDECHDAQCDKIVCALSIAHSVGGSDLGVVLRSLADALREDSKIRGEISARQSWTVNGAKLAAAAPWVTVILLSTHSDAWSAYTSPGGRTMLAFCAVATTVAYLIMKNIGKLPHDIRLHS